MNNNDDNWNYIKFTILFVLLLCFSYIYLHFDGDAALFNNKSTALFSIITSITAIFGVFSYLQQSSDSKRLNEAEFLLSINRLYFNIEKYQEILDLLENGNPDCYPEDFNARIIQYIDHFEPFYLLYKNKLTRFELIDDLFCFRFYCVVNNKYVQENIFAPHIEYYYNIARFHYAWSKYREKKGRTIPFIDQDLSKVVWYNDCVNPKNKPRITSRSTKYIGLNVTIRNADENDLPSIIELYSQFNNAVGKMKSHLSRIIGNMNRNGNNIIIGVYNDKIVATLQYTICQSLAFGGRPHITIEYFVVDKNFRKRGIGKQLLNYVKTEAININAASIIAVSSTGAKEAHHLYKNTGFDAKVKGFRMDL